jgi:2-methylcitrate dehydratase PrpD
MGYSGDTTVLDGEYGFWRFIGSKKWEPAVITDKLGQSWRFPQSTTYKIYPCCGALSTALDCFIPIINENKLQPEDIDAVKVYLDPGCEEAVWRNNDIKTDMEAQFSVAYNFSVAAHRVAIQQWQDSTTYRNPKILEFMKKVSFSPLPNYARIVKEDPTARPNRVEVTAKCRVFSEERRHPKGASINPATRITDEELVEKFKNNAHGVLLSSRICTAAEAILSLEKVDNVAAVVDLVTL